MLECLWLLLRIFLIEIFLNEKFIWKSLLLYYYIINHSLVGDENLIPLRSNILARRLHSPFGWTKNSKSYAIRKKYLKYLYLSMYIRYPKHIFIYAIGWTHSSIDSLRSLKCRILRYLQILCNDNNVKQKNWTNNHK